MSAENTNTTGRRPKEPRTQDQVRDALQDAASERGRAALVALLDYVAFLITAEPEGARLAAEVYVSAGRALKRNRKAGTMPADMEAHHGHFHGALLYVVSNEARETQEYFRRNRITRERDEREEREALAYLSRFTCRDGDGEWPEYIGA